MPQTYAPDPLAGIDEHGERVKRSVQKSFSFFEPVDTYNEGVEHFMLIVSSPFIFGLLATAAFCFSILALLAATTYFCVGSLNDSTDHIEYMGLGIIATISLAMVAIIAPAVLLLSLISRLVVTLQKPSLENQFQVAARTLDI